MHMGRTRRRGFPWIRLCWALIRVLSLRALPPPQLGQEPEAAALWARHTGAMPLSLKEAGCFMVLDAGGGGPTGAGQGALLDQVSS